MRRYYFLILLSFLACKRSENKTAHQSDCKTFTFDGDTTYFYKDVNYTKTRHGDRYIEFKNLDTNLLKSIWNYVAAPLIKKDKTHLKKTHYPITGPWACLTGINKSSDQLEDISLYYDQLFNDEFINILSKKSYKDLSVYCKNDTIGISYSISKNFYLNGDSTVPTGGASLLLDFREFNDTFRLYRFIPCGGAFY